MGGVLAKGKGTRLSVKGRVGGIIHQAEEGHSVSPPTHRTHKAVLPVLGPFGQPRTD